MNVDINQLLIVFDEMLYPPTDEDLGVYWLRIKRSDLLFVTLSFSIYENYADILIWNEDITFSAINMKICSAIRVLNEDKKCLEIIHGNSQGRCFLALSSNALLDYTE